MIHSINQEFIERFKRKPLLVEAPGRINIIGEHTDYNDGFVLPAAIDKKATFAIALNGGDSFRFYASDLDQYYQLNLIDLAPQEYHWANYLIGVLAQFDKEGIELKGVDCVFESNIPIGAGLSSSAAIECGFAVGLNYIYNSNFDKSKLAQIAQRAEHEFAGVKCGIMDQYASVFGKKDHVFRLDCRTHQFEYFPFRQENLALVLCDTQVKHELASSAYNDRRQECERGVTLLQRNFPNVQALRDVSMEMLESIKESFNPLTYKRCKYVIEENNRVNKACSALVEDDSETLGRLMYQSHHGLQNEFEVSCKELDILVDLTKKWNL